MASCFMDNAARLAGVMELVDVPDSKSGARDGVGVRVPPRHQQGSAVALSTEPSHSAL